MTLADYLTEQFHDASEAYCAARSDLAADRATRTQVGVMERMIAAGIDVPDGGIFAAYDKVGIERPQ